MWQYIDTHTHTETKHLAQSMEIIPNCGLLTLT